jgi:hypothetical protein
MPMTRNILALTNVPSARRCMENGIRHGGHVTTAPSVLTIYCGFMAGHGYATDVAFRRLFGNHDQEKADGGLDATVDAY